MESNGDANCLIVDGSGDKVGMGLAVPEGKLHIFTGDASVGPNGSADELVVEGSGDSGMSILSGASSVGAICFGDSSDDNVGKIQYSHSANGFDIVAGATDVGNWKTTGLGLYVNASSSRLKLQATADDEWSLEMAHTDADHPLGIQMYFSGGAPDDTTQKFIRCLDTGAERFQVLADGDCNNHDNTFGSISDERIKQDIRDANSQWDDIKAVKVRNFKKKDDVRQYGAEAWEQIVIIAQELESVSPKLIKEQDPNESDILSDSSFGTLVDDTDNPLTFYEDGDIIPEGKEIGDV